MSGKKTRTVAGVRSSDAPDGLMSSLADGWPFRRAKESPESENEEERIPMGVEQDSEDYNMWHKRRGVAVILNHIHFKSMATRNGTVKDALDLKATLSDLGFEVRVYNDPDVKTLSTILRSTEDHTDADCLVVATMSHGESGFLHSYDTLYPVDKLWNPFTADQCPSLAGKPKLFFIQACRGARLDEGVRIANQTDNRPSSYSIPAYADIMVAYSTYDGFYSWRNPDAGSWFIQAICEEFSLQGRKRDLLTLMTFVNRRVAVEYQSYVPQDQAFHAKKQIPSIVSMLTRLVYFSERRPLTPDDTDRPERKQETGTSR